MVVILRRRLKRKSERRRIVERLIAAGELPQGDPEE
jgi:hypothetical protein